MSRFQFRHSRTFSFQQLILLAVLMIGLFVIAMASAYAWLHRWPFFNAETSLYLVFSGQDVSDTEIDALKQISPIFVPQEQEDFFFQFIRLEAEENIIAKQYDGQLFFIQRNPSFDQTILGPFRENQLDFGSFYTKSLRIAGVNYRIFSHHPIEESWRPASLPLVLAKRSITHLKQAQTIVAWLKPRPQSGMSYFGTIATQQSVVFFKMAADAKSVNRSNVVIFSKLPPFTLNIDKPSVSLDALRRLLKVEDLDTFWPRLNNARISLTLEQGQMDELFTNPFEKGLIWNLSLFDLSQDQVNQLLLGTLQELSHIYPQVVERALPDGSFIMELIPETTAFLPLTGYNEKEGQFTFPDGQLQYHLDGDTLNIVKSYTISEVELEEVVVCQLPSSQFTLSVTQQMMPSLLFDQAFVSFSNDTFISCFMNRLSTEITE